MKKSTLQVRLNKRVIFDRRIEKKSLKKISRTLGIVGPGTPGRR